MDELIMLYRNIPVNQRYLYELILPTNKIKAYIDFEYYINNNPEIQNHSIGPIGAKSRFNSYSDQSNIPPRIKEIENEQDQQVQQLIPFVEKLIKRDKAHE
ncbi:unnamed protein product, partial [Rotaria sordida]